MTTVPLYIQLAFDFDLPDDTLPQNTLYRVYAAGEATPFDEATATPVLLGRRSTCRKEQKILVAQGLKRCRLCAHIKPLECFPFSRTHSAGRRNECRVCYSTRINSWRRSHPDIVSVQQAQWYRANAARERRKKEAYRTQNAALIRRRERAARLADPLFNAKARTRVSARRARLRGNGGRHTPAELDALFLEQESCCYYCGRLLDGHYARDHKQPLSRGGTDTIDNIALCCERCNTRKGAKSEEEFWAWLSYERAGTL